MTNERIPWIAGIIGGILGSIFTILVGSLIFSPEINQNPNIVPFTQDITEIVASSNDSVVAIAVKKRVQANAQTANPFFQLFGQNLFEQNSDQNGETEERVVGGGSGFITSSDGYIVTNAHVVDGEDVSFTAVLNDGREFDAQLIDADPILDIALLKIDATNLQFLSFGNSDELKLGQPVIAIGNALAEYQNTVSTGVISGLSRSITPTDQFGNTEILENVLQTDAAINPGNSGGPLLNAKGEVIGVNVAVARGSENIGFALPANDVAHVIDIIREEGRVVRPYIGVRYVMLTDALAVQYELTEPEGAFVHSSDASAPAVLEDSPAAKAGLQEGDIILSVNGIPLSSKNSLATEIRRHNVGDTIELSVKRGEETRLIRVTLAEYTN